MSQSFLKILDLQSIFLEEIVKSDEYKQLIIFLCCKAWHISINTVKFLTIWFLMLSLSRLDNKIIHYPKFFKTNIKPTLLFSSSKLEPNQVEMFFDQISAGDWTQVCINSFLFCIKVCLDICFANFIFLTNNNS